jgi:ubiquinone/menaquinone biosynthesis C-methylase UbiE
MGVQESMGLLNYIHEQYIHRRRITRLVQHIERLIPKGAFVVDVGCGDGLLASKLVECREDISIQGFEPLIRPTTFIPVIEFDGASIPCESKSIDCALLIDVLHHTRDPRQLLSEAKRVSRDCIVLKDHLLNGWLAKPTLTFMDWVGNARHKVPLPYNYLTQSEWNEIFKDLGLRVALWNTRLGLYNWFLQPIFGRSLHYIAKLVDKDS